MTEDPGKLAVLTLVPSEIEAAAIVAALDSNGIAAAQEGGLTSGFRAEAPGQVRVLVPAAQLAEAREILAELAETGAREGDGDEG